MNPYDVVNDAMFQKFFGKILTSDEIMKSDKKGFNQYCAEVMEYDLNDLERIKQDDPEFLPYNPYDDLNQMAEVVEKLGADMLGVDVSDHLQHGHNLKNKGIKQAFRDFITSTMEKDNE